MNYDCILALAHVHAGRTEVGNNLLQYRGLVLCAIFCMSSQQVCFFFLYLRLVHFFFPWNDCLCVRVCLWECVSKPVSSRVANQMSQQKKWKRLCPLVKFFFFFGGHFDSPPKPFAHTRDYAKGKIPSFVLSVYLDSCVFPVSLVAVIPHLFLTPQCNPVGVAPPPDPPPHLGNA